MLKKFTSLAAVALMGLMVLPSAANATLKLRATDGSETFTITNEGAGDGTADIAGLAKITAIISFASGTVLNTNTATELLTETPPSLDLFVDVTTTAAQTITVMVTQIGFSTTSLLDLVFGFGGTSDGSVTSELWIDAANAEFGLGTLLGTLGPAGGISYSGGLNAIAPIDALYSVTLVTKVTHTGGTKITTADTRVKVPEPGTLAILGMGLLGMGLTGRRRRKVAA